MNRDYYSQSYHYHEGGITSRKFGLCDFCFIGHESFARTGLAMTKIIGTKKKLMKFQICKSVTRAKRTDEVICGGLISYDVR